MAKYHKYTVCIYDIQTTNDGTIDTDKEGGSVKKIHMFSRKNQ